MKAMLLRRVLQLITVVWGVGTLTFILMRSLPGDMAYRRAASRYGQDNVNSEAAAGTPESLLASLGWKKNAQGMLERNGEPFELTLITYADRPELTTVATAIQAQWEAIGVSTKVEVTNSSAIAMGHQDGSLEVALMARNYGFIADPLGVMLSDFGSNGGGDWGAMNWNNSEFSADLMTLEHTSDPAKYKAIAQRSAQIIYDERPMIPVSAYVQQTSVNTRIKGFRFDPFERSFYLNEMEFVKP